MGEVAAGNRAAFTLLARRHVRRGLAIATRVLGNTADAEEVVQDSLMQVWRHAPDWRGDGSRFSTWLHRIVVNRCLSMRRRHRRVEPLEAAAAVTDGRPDAVTVIEGRDLAARVDAAIAALPPRQRVALSLCHYEEMSCAEAAAVMGVSVSSMESLLVRARRAVRDRLRRADGMGKDDEP